MSRIPSTSFLPCFLPCVMMASLILEIGPSMLYRDPFCPGIIPPATGYLVPCFGGISRTPSLALCWEKLEAKWKSQRAVGTVISSSTSQALAGGRGRCSLCKHLSLPGSQQCLSHHSFGLSPPCPFPAPLPSSSFLTHIFCFLSLSLHSVLY